MSGQPMYQWMRRVADIPAASMDAQMVLDEICLSDPQVETVRELCHAMAVAAVSEAVKDLSAAGIVDLDALMLHIDHDRGGGAT